MRWGVQSGESGRRRGSTAAFILFLGRNACRTLDSMRLKRPRQMKRRTASLRRRSRRLATAVRHTRVKPRGAALLLVSLSLQKLPLLVLSHLLAALLDDTTQNDFSLRRFNRRSGPMFRESALVCQPRPGGPCIRSAARRSGFSRDPLRGAERSAQPREKALSTRLRAVPSARFTGWRRGRKGMIGSRRLPREAIDARISWCPGSIIWPRRR